MFSDLVAYVDDEVTPRLAYAYARVRANPNPNPNPNHNHIPHARASARGGRARQVCQG